MELKEKLEKVLKNAGNLSASQLEVEIAKVISKDKAEKAEKAAKEAEEKRKKELALLPTQADYYVLLNAIIVNFQNKSITDYEARTQVTKLNRQYSHLEDKASTTLFRAMTDEYFDEGSTC